MFIPQNHPATKYKPEKGDPEQTNKNNQKSVTQPLWDHIADIGSTLACAGNSFSHLRRDPCFKETKACFIYEQIKKDKK